MSKDCVLCLKSALGLKERGEPGQAEAYQRDHPSPTVSDSATQSIRMRLSVHTTRISASSAARDRNRSTMRPSTSLMKSNIRHSVARFSTSRQPDSIYDRDTLTCLLESRVYSARNLR